MSYFITRVELHNANTFMDYQRLHTAMEQRGSHAPSMWAVNGCTFRPLNTSMTTPPRRKPFSTRPGQPPRRPTRARRFS
jgi:hypothetical protein